MRAFGLGSVLCIAFAMVPVSVANPTPVAEGVALRAPGDSLMVSFPFKFDVSQGNRLYVYGQAVASVALTPATRGTLRLNGVPVRTDVFCTTRRYPTLSDEMLERVYGDVPYLGALRAGGSSIREAATRFLLEHSRLMRSAYVAYLDALELGSSKPDAIAGAREAMFAADTLGLLYVTEADDVSADGWWYRQHGIPGRAHLTAPDLAHGARDPAPDADYALALRSALVGGDEPCWYFIHRDGETAFVGREMVEDAAAQLDAALRSGRLTEYPIGSALLLEVQEASKGD